MATAGVALVLSLAMALISLMQNTSMHNTSTTISAIAVSLIIAVWGASHMAAFVINQVRVMQAGKEAQSFALSLNISACNLGIALGAMCGGYVVQHYGIEFIGYAGATMVAIAFVIALGFMLFNSAVEQ